MRSIVISLLLSSDTFGKKEKLFYIILLRDRYIWKIVITYMIYHIIWFCDKERVVTRLALFLSVCSIWQKTNVPAVAATSFGNDDRIHQIAETYILWQNIYIQRQEHPIRTDRNIYPMTETYIKWKKHISYDRNIYPKKEIYILRQKHISYDRIHLSNDKKSYQMTIYIYQMTETYILWQTKYLSPPGQNIWTPCQNVSGYTYTLYPDSVSLTLWEDISILIVQLSNWKQH